jgi:hypothetical protein
MGKWKGVKSNMKSDPSSLWEIYDLEKDPSESTDLGKQHPALATRFNEILKQEHTCPHIREWEFVDSKMPKAK